MRGPPNGQGPAWKEAALARRRVTNLMPDRPHSTWSQQARLAVVAALLAVGLATAPGVGAGASDTTLELAAETPIHCGMVVSGTIKVANDLVCIETTGLIVGSDNTKIDLNGHRISCIGVGYEGSCQGVAHGITLPDEEPEDGVLIQARNNVHVLTTQPGGTIDGFDNGIRIERSTEVKIEHLTITGPPSPGPVNPRPFSHGILIRGTSCPGGEGNIHLGTGEQSGNDLSNANQGIAINGSCVHVVHNVVHHNNSTHSVPSNGILLNNASGNVVRGNQVFMNGDQPETDLEKSDGGITLRNNSRDNHITNNIVNDNLGDGISVRLGSERNKIDNNTMLRNGAHTSGTLYYDAAGRQAPGGPPGSEPLNEWNQNNVCVTQNEEVPPGTCGPEEGTTA